MNCIKVDFKLQNYDSRLPPAYRGYDNSDLKEKVCTDFHWHEVRHEIFCLLRQTF